MSDQNILIPFPSLYDPMLRVSTLDPNMHINIIDVSGGSQNYFEAREALSKLPSVIASKETPEGVATLNISNRSRKKLLNEIGNYESNLKEVYMATIHHLVNLISNSLLLEEHRDRKKDVNGRRLREGDSDPHIEKVQRLFGAVGYKSDVFRAKTTIQVNRETAPDGRLHLFDIVEVELLDPKPHDISLSGPVALSNNSISIANLLKSFELSYEPGIKITEAMSATRVYRLTGDNRKMYELYKEALYNGFSNLSFSEESFQVLGPDWRERLLKIDNKIITKNKKKGLKL